MKRRSALLFIIFICFMIFLGFKLIQINFLDNNNYKQTVLSQQVSNMTDTINHIVPKRGVIYDARGIALAESNMVYHVIFDPKVLNVHEEDVIQSTIDFLVMNLEDVTTGQLRDHLVNDALSNYVPIARSLSYPEVKAIIEAIDNLEIKGVSLEEQYQRQYPYGTMASDILGFVRADGIGSYGAEQYYNDYLTGEEGRRFGAVDQLQQIVQEDVEAKDGYNVHLNIDFTIQTYIEDALKAFFEEEEALSAGAIIMNPQNGQIYGMASYPDYDLNDPNDLTLFLRGANLDGLSDKEVTDLKLRMWTNDMVFSSYEPGSTFKPITIAMALEEYIVTTESTFYCGGSKIPYEGEDPINCHKLSGHGEQTLLEALSNSCNVALMDVGEAVGRDLFDKYQRSFGFGAVTNSDVFGEQSVRNLVYDIDELDPVQLATSSFGQGSNVTPLQLINGFSAIINGGYLYEPQLMSRVTDETGTIIYENKPVINRKVISEDVSAQLLSALQQVVDEGTGKRAAIEGYKIGGKTGTAEKKDRTTKDYIVSFIGFSPTDHPEVICLVVVDDPVGEKVNSRYAAGIFKDIMEDVLPYLRIPKTYEEVEPSAE